MSGYRGLDLPGTGWLDHISFIRLLPTSVLVSYAQAWFTEVTGHDDELMGLINHRFVESS